MIEVENLTEFRALLREENKLPLHLKIRNLWARQTTEHKVIAGVLVFFTIGLTFIALQKGPATTTTTATTLDSILKRNEEKIWHYNTNEEREVFLKLWNEAEENVLSGIGSLAKNPNGKYAQRSLLFAECELILESVKRSLKKCVSLEMLPEKCKKLLLGSMKCNQDSLRYRAWDGSCNNLQHTDWGMTGDNFNRWLDAAYSDDVSSLRQSVVGGDLPSVRHLSNLLFSRKTLPDSNTSMFFAYFGMFLGHDMGQTGQTAGNETSCCGKDPTKRDPSCIRIEIAEDDPFYGPLNITCKAFFRTPPFTGSCPGRREQQNRQTSYIDASQVYGSSHEEGRSLRTGKRGLLRHSTVHGEHLLPQQNSGSACFARNSNSSCFLAGDNRVNMVLPLTTLHTMWFREHNLVAAELSRINPKWDDETLYQEARKIAIAQYQHIIYTEYLPIIFGSQQMKAYDLLIEEDKTYSGYDKNINAGINNAFSTAAFRFGHTLVQSTVQLRDENYDLKSEMPLHDTYNNPSALYNQGLDDVIRGMIGQKAQEPEAYTTEEVRDRLNQRSFMSSGNDLTAMSILRGRDHGIPGWFYFRRFCGLETPNEWLDVQRVMREGYSQKLHQAYTYFKNIDLMTGAMGEKPLDGSLLGPTYICLLGKQFSNLRKGDRFWYENLNHPGALTEDQLKEIYKVTSARIVCDTSDNIQKVPKNPFYVLSEENPMLDCNEIPTIDLNHWKESGKAL